MNNVVVSLDTRSARAHNRAMEDDPQRPNPRPNPVDDLRHGFGLLFRAAKTAASQLPTSKLETAVLSGARELGRAASEVAHSIEEQLFGSRRETTTTPNPSERDNPGENAKAPATGSKPSPPADGDLRPK
jgi:hypothetical protein